MLYVIPISLFCLAAGLTPLAARWARHLKIVDHPEGTPLKIHTEPRPLCGGMVLAVCLTVGSLIYLTQYPFSKAGVTQIILILVAGLLVFFVGLKDDKAGLHPGFRLGIHFFSASIVLLMGIRFGMLPCGIAGICITLFCLVGTLNAWNFIDGMDGLCASLALISGTGFLMLGYGQSNNVLMVFALIMGVSLLGILLYNLFPARIFLGDSGSGLLGLLLSSMVIVANPGIWNLKVFLGFMLLIGIPLADIFIAVMRRIFSQRPLFQGDRNHIYDLLLKKGWSQPKVWALLCGIQVLFVLAGLKILETVTKPC